MTNPVGGTHLRTPPSIFQHMMGSQNSSQQLGVRREFPQIHCMSFATQCMTQRRRNIELKRKFHWLEDHQTRPQKQFITEEKMTAHFKNLHISTHCHPQNPLPSTSKADTQCASGKELNMELELDGTNTIDSKVVKPGHSKLVLSDELKRLQPEPALPSALLSKFFRERPSMALVLWEPPSKHFHILPSRDTPTPIPNVTDDNNNNDNNSSNNNNEAVPDLNRETTNSPAAIFEPMEL